MEESTVKEINDIREFVTEKHNCPYFVAIDKTSGSVIGYTYAGPYRLRPAYRHTVEDSIYVHRDHHRKGIASALLSTLIDECEKRGFRQMICIVGDSENAGSLTLHERHGFKKIGNFPSIAYKFGQYLDTPLLQLSLGEGDSTPPTLPPARP